MAASYRSAAVVILALWGLGCDAGYRAELRDGAGLEVGSPVMSAGVVVGEVRSIRVARERVEVELVIADEHELILHEDACVIAGRYEGTPSLHVLPGERGSFDRDEPLPSCELHAADVRSLMRDLGEAMGEMLRGAHDGFFADDWPGWPAFDQPPPSTPPSTPSPAVPALRTPCDDVTVRIDEIEVEPPTPLALPDGGHRVFFVFDNAGPEAVALPARGEAMFLDPDRRRREPAMLADREGWFMPITIPAAGSARTSVVFPHDGSRPFALGGIEIDGLHLPSNPLSRCALQATFDPPPP